LAVLIFSPIQVALGLWWFVLRQFTILTVFKTEGQKYQKNYKNFSKIHNYKYLMWCTESEMTAIPTYHLRQSGMRLMKLLK
jgi:hypothetical protein